MAHDPTIEDLFDRWELVWRRPDLIQGCLAPIYTRHGSSIQSSFTRTHTAEEYGRVIVAERERAPDTRFVMHDNAFDGDRVWFRGTAHRTDPETAQPTTRAYIQVYRVEAGKLAETWLALHDVGSAWPDTTGLEHWTSRGPARRESAMPELFDKWERVIYAGHDELVSEWLAPIYTRHGSSIQAAFTRAYTREEYAQVVAAERARFPDMRHVMYDHAFPGDRAWFRGTMQRTDPATGRRVTRAYVQIYRVEDGKLSETWVALHPEGTAWLDPVGQEHWSSDRPGNSPSR